jgi:predicted nucleic acid-binding protein
LTRSLAKRTIVRMKCVADTNTFLAVALGEPEKAWLVDVTHGGDLVAPAILPYEVANALSALVKRGVVLPGQAAAVWGAIANVPVDLAEIDIRAALLLAVANGIYAYDAYFLQCAREARCPLLTLDKGMKRVARELGIDLLEQP